MASMRKASTFSVGERRASDNILPSPSPVPKDTVKFPSPPRLNSSTSTSNAFPSSSTIGRVPTDKTSPPRPRSQSLLTNSAAHKRTSSGNILAHVPFLRTNSSDNSSEGGIPRSATSHGGLRVHSLTGAVPLTASQLSTHDAAQLRRRNTTASNDITTDPSKNAKRQVSLRKTTLLTNTSVRPSTVAATSNRIQNASTTTVDVGSRKSLSSLSTSLDGVKRSATRGSPTSPRSPRSPAKQSFSFSLSSENSSAETIPRIDNEWMGGHEEAPRKASTSTLKMPMNGISATPNISGVSSLPDPLRPRSPSKSFSSSRHVSTVSNNDRQMPFLEPSTMDSNNLLSPPQSLNDRMTPTPSPPSSDSSSLVHPPTHPHPSTVLRRLSTKSIPIVSAPLTSPLSVSGTITSDFDFPTDEWDYSDTEWWGWIILAVTWIVVVVGMGSCLGVWSWAWDVEKKPYAPPELEDDPTLPIVGYYPALMVMTAVVSWVWVVVAWMGMKYFKHAKIQTED